LLHDPHLSIINQPHLPGIAVDFEESKAIDAVAVIERLVIQNNSIF